jgi:cyclohexa-1,5-dienecarbonyl-CoA hydratase
MALPIPTVAAVNGAALGGGLELALACDMLVAADGSKLGQPEIKLGVFPPIAAILLPRIVPVPRAMELVLGGGTIDAREALSIGLVNRVFPRASFAADTEKFLEQFLSLSRAALIYTKRAMREAAGRPFHEALYRVEQIYLDLVASKQGAG